MSFNAWRRHFPNCGGFLHVCGNLALTFGFVASAGRADWPALSAAAVDHWPSFGAGLLFLAGSLVLSVRGHHPNGYAAGNVLAAAGYAVLLHKAWHDAAWSSIAGTIIGTAAALYAAVQAWRLRRVILKTHALENMDVFTLRQRLAHHVTLFTRRFPFWPSGVTELGADLFLLVGAMKTGDMIMAGVALLWAIGSVLLALALPEKPAARLAV